jgi:hypothetical protein
MSSAFSIDSHSSAIVAVWSTLIDVTGRSSAWAL